MMFFRSILTTLRLAFFGGAWFAISCSIVPVNTPVPPTPICHAVPATNAAENARPTQGAISSPIHYRDGTAILGAEFQEGLLAVDTTPATAARELELIHGGMILKINSTPVTTRDDLDRVVRDLSPGENISVIWQRDDTTCWGKGVLGVKHKFSALTIQGAESERQLEISLDPGMRLEFYWVESSHRNVDFNLVDPAGDSELQSSRKFESGGSFLVKSSGLHHLVFKNRPSLFGRSVTLYYQIRAINK